MNTTSDREDHMTSPLSSRDHRKSDDVEFAGFAPFKAKHEAPSKLLVYVLSVTVAVSAVILLFAVVFLHATTPDAELTSVTVSSLTYTNPSAAVNSSANATATAPPSLNATLAAAIAVRNTNLGRFEYANSSAAVFFEGVEIGRGKVARGRVGGKSTARIDFTVDVSSDVEMGNSTSFRSAVDLGVLEVTSYAELRGRVHLINLIERDRIAIVSCTMNLNLRNRTVEELTCK